MSELTDEQIALWRNGLNSIEDLKRNNIDETFTWAHGISQRGIQYLQSRAENSPFLMVLSYDEPHHPFTCPKEYVERYQDFYYDLGAKGSDPLINKPEHHRLWAEAMPSPVTENNLYHHPLYFACNDFVDDQIGKVIDELDKLELDNTWVVYTSDHGEMMGAHKLISKGAAMYDDITNIPLIIRPPKEQQQPHIVSNPVSHIDILPTLMHLADIPVPEAIVGRNLCLLDTQEDKQGVMVEFNRYEIEHDSFGGFVPVRCWITEKYKLVINLLGTDEFYDRQNDTDELNNLINSEQHESARNELHDQLLNYMESIRDPFRSYQWLARSWRKNATKDWMGAFRPKPKDGYSPVIRDYDTGMPTQGTKVESKTQKF